MYESCHFRGRRPRSHGDEPRRRARVARGIGPVSERVRGPGTCLRIGILEGANAGCSSGGTSRLPQHRPCVWSRTFRGRVSNSSGISPRTAWIRSTRSTGSCAPRSSRTSGASWCSSSATSSSRSSGRSRRPTSSSRSTFAARSARPSASDRSSSSSAAWSTRSPPGRANRSISPPKTICRRSATI